MRHLMVSTPDSSLISRLGRACDLAGRLVKQCRLWRYMQGNRWQLCAGFYLSLLLTGLAGVSPASGGSLTVTLTATGTSGQPVGTQIVWTAKAAGAAGIL